MVLCLVTIVYIVGMVPVWVPLCMVAGLIFDVPLGTLSVMIGHYFYRVPIRESLFDGAAFAYRFMWRSLLAPNAPVARRIVPSSRREGNCS